MTKETNDQDFENDVLNSDVPVLVDFWAEWCGPCRQLSATIDQIAEEYEGKVKVFKVNIENSPETPTKYEVRGIPNLILFKGGEVVDSKVGAVQKQVLSEWLDKNIA